MHHTIALLSLVLISSLLSSEVNSVKPESAIAQVLRQQVDAWNRHDLEGFMAGYWNSPELTFFSGAHESKGWQAALDRYKKSYQGAGHEMGKLEFSNLRIEMLGRKQHLCGVNFVSRCPTERRRAGCSR